MALQNITYNEIVETVKNYIKTNCMNIANFGAIPAAFKAGYTLSGNISSSGDRYTSKYVVTITRAVTQVASSVVDTDMNNFLARINVANKLNNNVPASEFINFINDIVSFCSTKLCFATSQYNGNRYLIYYTANTSYSSIVSINTNESNKIVQANDVNSILNMLLNVIKQNIRNIPCTYNIALS